MRDPLNPKVPWKRLTLLQNRRIEASLRRQAADPNLSPQRRRKKLIAAGNLKAIRKRLAAQSPKA